jgi:hypothetical protein
VWDCNRPFRLQPGPGTVKKLQADLAKLRLDVGYEVKTYHLNIQDAAKRISVARTGLEAAQEGYRMAVARYQAQVGTNSDVLDSQYQLTRAEADLTQALADYQIAAANLYVAWARKTRPGPQLRPDTVPARRQSRRRDPKPVRGDFTILAGPAMSGHFFTPAARFPATPGGWGGLKATFRSC